MAVIPSRLGMFIFRLQITAIPVKMDDYIQFAIQKTILTDMASYFFHY